MNERWAAPLRRCGWWLGLLALQACGGGDVTTPTERAAAVATTAVTTATVTGLQNFTLPDGRVRFVLNQMSDGTLRLDIAVASGLTGDLRAIYFHIAGDNVGGLNVSGAQVTAVKVLANAVTQAGAADTRLARQSGVAASGPFDVGVELGTRSTTGSDGITSSSITIARTGSTLVLADFRFLDNTEGQAWMGLVAADLGDPSVRKREDVNLVFNPAIPVPPPPPPKWVYEVGAGHACWSQAPWNYCVGDNSFGQATAQTNLAAGATQLAAGVRHTCGLGQVIDPTTGNLVPGIACWGAGSTDLSRSLPLPAMQGTPTQVAAGNDTTCAATSNFEVHCWRATADAAQLGAYLLPVAALDLAVGASQACSVNFSGQLQCWDKDSGTAAGAPATTFTQIDAYGSVGCGTTTAATVACWTMALATIEPSTPPPLTNVTQVAVGQDFACAISNSIVNCWATGLTAPDPRVLAVPDLGPVRSIEAGGSTVCAQKNSATSSETVCWGALTNTLYKPPLGE